jgi:outer membrane protein assembly factor BamB
MFEIQRFQRVVRLAWSGLLFAFLPVVPFAAGGDWPMWGHDETRNMACDEVGLPTDFDVGQFVGASDEIDPETTRNIKWLARLGSQSYGNPTVAGGRVFVGTNNDVPRDPRLGGDRSCLYCLDEATGEFLWQLSVPKLGTGIVSDWEFVGICSSATVVGDRAYLVTNRCEVICLDVKGLKDGNEGPFVDEAQYLAGPGEKPIPTTETDADIVWVLDMMATCGVLPHNITSSAPLVVGEQVWVTTSNGADVEHGGIPASAAPSLIVVDRRTGALIAEEASGISRDMFHASWSSPAYLRTAQGELCIFGGPDGFCHAFAPVTLPDGRGKTTLEEVWRFDCNPAELRRKDGAAIPYGKREGPSEVLATPVVYEERVYCSIGQEPGYCEGPGSLVCLDAEGKEVWSTRKVNRSMSTPAIRDGLLFVADYAGFLYCFDARTGEHHWTHDTMGVIWGSPLVADGKVYLGNEDAYLFVFAASAEYVKKEVLELDVYSPVYSSPIAANGVLYLATNTHLFAIETPKD